LDNVKVSNTTIIKLVACGCGLSDLFKMVKPCWRTCVGDDATEKVDGLLWYKNLGNHVYGEFSMAVIQANSLMEDQSQLESGPLSSTNSGPQGTFVGVYDGHGGTEASKFINHNVFSNFKSMFSA
jgi:pyruvate dehydrogenase phosphatase